MEIFLFALKNNKKDYFGWQLRFTTKQTLYDCRCNAIHNTNSSWKVHASVKNALCLPIPIGCNVIQFNSKSTHCVSVLCIHTPNKIPLSLFLLLESADNVNFCIWKWMRRRLNKKSCLFFLSKRKPYLFTLRFVIFMLFSSFRFRFFFSFSIVLLLRITNVIIRYHSDW